MHTTRDTATAILHRHGADYLLSVKGNASETYAALHTIDWDQAATASFREHRARAMVASSSATSRPCNPRPSMLNYPQVKQMSRIMRYRHTVKTSVDSHEIAYGITSLSPDSADAKRLLALNRGHWTIETATTASAIPPSPRMPV